MTDHRDFGDTPPPSQDHDFSEFGEVEREALSRLTQLGGDAVSRNWRTIPHVTHCDEADVTGLDDAREGWNARHPHRKLSLVPLLAKALVDALAAFPRFNASLSADGKSLLMRKFFNVGFAIDTPRGLVVGVVRECDRKSAEEIAVELRALSEQARRKGLSVAQMSGGCITISSLGHIGGLSFTPIVNWPEVAILGLTRVHLRTQPGPEGAVQWRKMLPLCLSYDHRVINGADAARFTRFLADWLHNAALPTTDQ